MSFGFMSLCLILGFDCYCLNTPYVRLVYIWLTCDAQIKLITHKAKQVQSWRALMTQNFKKVVPNASTAKVIYVWDKKILST